MQRGRERQTDLADCPREAIQNEASAALRSLDGLLDNAYNNVIGDQGACIDCSFGLSRQGMIVRRWQFS